MKLAATGSARGCGISEELSLGEEVLAGCDIGHNLAGQTSRGPFPPRPGR